ncbi:DUF4838 domain-containing protein [Chitinophaga vietnamensis]|uniref:DUF4838 domain-containing protein n=1 Tax=Chitinophaga vietnamensis TaxID=2593957 RepID=UPI001375641B|nr:DUF4838 domain-containing protein [Chitinophaga vietnamensis]
MNSLLLASMLVVHSCTPPENEISLVSGGKSAYVIVTPATPTKAESKAATVFQDMVNKISGARLPIVPEGSYQQEPAVFIGQTNHSSGPDKIKADGFFAGMHNKNLYIRGGGGQGVLHGVYYVLETYMHCRKDADVPAYVPKEKNIQLPGSLNDLREPAFIYRETYYPASTDPEYLDWHGLHRFEDLWGVWGHSFFKIVPPKTYFAEHPEYFSLVDGKRQPMQLCLSNPQVFELAVAYFKKAIRENPDAMYWSIAAEDGPGACTCDQCRAADAAEGSAAGSLIRFVNRIAQQFPEQRFTTLAYGYTAKPPKTKPAPNVYIMLSTIDAYRQEPLATAPSAAAFRNHLQGWEALTDHLFIWDYTTQFTNYLAPFPDYTHLQANLQYFAAHHVQGVFSQGSGDTYGDMAEYNSYVQASLLWQPNADMAALNKAFFKSYYGAAGPYIQQYQEALSAAVKSTHAVLDIYGSPVYSAKDYLSPEKIDQYSVLLDKAEAAAGSDSVLLKRVLKVRLPLEYTVLQQSRSYGTDKFGYLLPDGNSFKVNPKWPARVQHFVAACKTAMVKELSEGGASPDTYAQEWQALFNRAWVQGLAFGAPVKLANAYTPEYTPKGERTLTDGLPGGKDFSYNWLYTYDKDMIATVDLGSSKKIQQVSMNFLFDPRHYIFHPAHVLVETSADGQHYTVAGQQDIPVPAEDYEVQIKHFNFPVSANARYIRVSAQCPAALPAWRHVAGKRPAICCDEIFVE